jgi:hypothetical protein
MFVTTLRGVKRSFPLARIVEMLSTARRSARPADRQGPLPRFRPVSASLEKGVSRFAGTMDINCLQSKVDPLL